MIARFSIAFRYITTACIAAVSISAVQAAPCIVTDAVATGGLPPVGCEYVPVNDNWQIIDGLPPGTTIDSPTILRNFATTSTTPGGSLGGEVHKYAAELHFSLTGTGTLVGFNRNIVIPLDVGFDVNQMHSAPRNPAAPLQTFDTQVFRMFGQITGDPDFDLMRVVGGTDFGLPSPGHTTLLRQGPPGSNWAVDSFFDITYRIDFVGAPGGSLAGMSGSTTATIRMQAGEHIPIIPEPASLALVGMACCGIGAAKLRRRLG